MRRAPIIIGMIWATMCASAPAIARADDTASRTAAEKVKAGNEFLAQQQYADALAAYDEAKKALPESAEVAYNRGIALYRLGEYEKATKALQDALKPDKPELESKVKYNLGRNAHESAIAKREKLPEAIDELSKAVSFYKDALSLNDKDADARKNMEEAERLRAFFEKRLKEQQQEKDKKPSSQPTSQPDKKEPTSQPDKQQQTSQPSSQPQEDKEQKGDQKKDEQGEEDKKDQQKQDDSKKEKGKQGKDQKDKQSQDQKDSDADKQDGKEGQSGEEDKDQKMKAEEVEPMLQEARDAEKARREAKHARMMRLRGKIPVAKDW